MVDPPYQLDFWTPGSSPWRANLRKHRRQSSNLRMKPRGRPQLLQRLRCWVENFGLRESLTILEILAIGMISWLLAEGHTEVGQQGPGLGIVLGGSHEGDVHALELVHL